MPSARPPAANPLAFTRVPTLDNIPPPKRVNHASTLWWWLALAAGALTLLLIDEWPRSRPSAAPPVATETEAFHAFSFGDVQQGDARAIEPQILREQLQRLAQAGAHTVRLSQLQAFLTQGTPLPAKPVLLVFEDAGRETVDAVDPILADLGMNATAFVSVMEVTRGNIALVSRRRLAAMAHSGRWDFGVSDCGGTAPDALPDFRAQIASLTDWTGAKPGAAACLRDATMSDERRAGWDAALPLGFVGRIAGANLRSDPPAELRLIHLGASDRDPDALLRRVNSRGMREGRFVDDFKGGRLSPEWLADPAGATVQHGALHLAAPAGSNAGSLMLAGTERWRDAQLTVDLEAPSHGQFWIYARYTGAESFLRLGIDAHRVVMQKAAAGTPTRQLATMAAPSGRLRLTLRVIGPRALAWVNGQLLTDRAMEVPAELKEGPMTVTTWDPATAAAAVLHRIELQPWPRTMALVPRSPDEETFRRLRDHVDELWGISPKLHTWHVGGLEDVMPDPALELFAMHHRLAVLPAVAVDALPPAGAAMKAFATQMLQWARANHIDGLNLVIGQLPPERTAELEQLRHDMAALGKELTFTVAGPADAPPTPLAWLAAGSNRPAAFHVTRAAPSPLT